MTIYRLIDNRKLLALRVGIPGNLFGAGL